MRRSTTNLVLAVSALVACHRAPEEVATTTATAISTEPTTSGCPDDPEPGLRPLPTTSLTIAGFDTKPLTVEVELAKGEHDSERGLMYRTWMPEMRGMIFEMDRADHMFWMHNTCIPLDLVYIDRGQIVGIVEAAPILNDDPRGVGKLSDEVLELNAGFCKRHGVKAGQHVTKSGKSG